MIRLPDGNGNVVVLLNTLHYKSRYYPLLKRKCIFPALKRADSGASSLLSANKRKDSSVGSQLSSEQAAEGGESSPGPEDSPRPPEQEKRDPIAEEMAKFDIPEPDEPELETNMPWLKVISRLINSFNFYCTHQGFCHPNCYRRQMRATKRIMEASRHVSKILITLGFSGFSLINII